MLTAESNNSFSPPRWLRNPHVQSILPSLRWRHPLIARRAGKLLAVSRSMILDCGEGVRLLGYLSEVPRFMPSSSDRQLIVLLHGWEGSADSAYVLSLGAHLFERGYDIFRLNFRDHGDTHSLNEGIFHSCR